MSTNYYAEHAWSDLSNSCLKEKTVLDHKLIMCTEIRSKVQNYLKKKIDMYV